MKYFSLAICIAACQLLAYKCDASSNVNHVVEIYLAIDQKVVNGYVNRGSTPANARLEVMRDANYFLSQVDEIIHSAHRHTGIRVRQIDILEEDVFDDCQLLDGVFIHEHFGLSLFYRYLQKKGLFNSINYDAALLWTGYDMIGQRNFTAAFSTSGTACKANAVAMMEYDGTYRAVHRTAQQIGYILGLQEDEGQCDHGYIMAEPLSFSTHRWEFSPCSINRLSLLIPTLACLTTTSSASHVPHGPASPALRDVDEVCRRARNDTKSYMCKSSNLYNGAPPQGDIVCARLYCHISGTNNCSGVFTTNGTICGENQRCHNGQCLDAPSNLPTPPGLHADCLYGDFGSVTINDQKTNCSAFFATDGFRRDCYNLALEQACCATCHSFRGGILGCPYGDKSPDCVKYPRDQVCRYYRDTLCCEHCNGWRSKRRAGGPLTHLVLHGARLDNVTLEVGYEKERDSSTTVV